MRSEKRQVKRDFDGSYQVVTTKRYTTPEEIIRLRDRLRGDVAAAKNLLSQLEVELADLEAVAASFDDSQRV